MQAGTRDQGESRLLRALGVRQLATTIFNYTVGSGIFALPAIAVAHLGAAAPLAYLVCMGVMALVLLCFAEAGSRVSRTGGVYAYVQTALGPLAGSVAGAVLFLTGLFGGAAVAVLFAGTLSALLGIQSAALSSALALSVVALLTWLNVRGVRNSARTMEFITLVKILPLLAFVLVGAAFIHPANLHWQVLPSARSVFGTAGIVIFAFSGIESALAPSGEVREPWRTVPLASVLALAAATALYLAIQWVALGVLGPKLATEPVTPLAQAAAVFAGTPGHLLMIAAATISMLGYLSANILSTPRAIFAFARDGFLPSALAVVHERYRTPHRAVILHGVLVAALALSGTYEQLAKYSNLTAFVLYILCAISVWILRRRDVRSEGRPFLMPGGALVPILTCAVNGCLIAATAARKDWIGLAVVVAAALTMYAVRRGRQL